MIFELCFPEERRQTFTVACHALLDAFSLLTSVSANPKIITLELDSLLNLQQHFTQYYSYTATLNYSSAALSGRLIQRHRSMFALLQAPSQQTPCTHIVISYFMNTEEGFDCNAGALDKEEQPYATLSPSAEEKQNQIL